LIVVGGDDLDGAFRAAASVLGAGGPVGLVCHVNPDGDALGSTLALHHLCRAHGVASVVSWPEPFAVATHYRSVPGLADAVSSSSFPARPSSVFTFDCGSLRRLGELRGPAEWARDHGELIVVDHHVTNERYGTVNLIDTGAAATAVVVRELARRMGWALDRDAAWCLYTGVVTDSGRFSYSCTSPALFALAEELSGFDLPIDRLTRELFDEHPFAYLKLAAAVLARAELVDIDGRHRVVSSWVTQDDLDTYGVAYDDIEGLIDWLRTAAEAEVAMLGKQTDEGVRVSLRARSELDVGAVAAALGGGGHRLASGFTMQAPVGEILGAVVGKLRSGAS